MCHINIKLHRIIDSEAKDLEEMDQGGDVQFQAKCGSR